MLHTAIATTSGLLIGVAVVFGAMALAVTGLVIGFAGALTSHLRPRPSPKPAVVTLNATRTGRGWTVDPSDR
jgi:hypothetical protein